MATADMGQEFKTLLGQDDIDWAVAANKLYGYLMENDFVFDSSAHTRMNHAAIQADLYGGANGISVELGHNGGAGAGRSVVDAEYLVGGEQLVFTAPPDSSGVSKLILFGWLLDGAASNQDWANIVPVGIPVLEALPAGVQLSYNLPSGLFNLNAGV